MSRLQRGGLVPHFEIESIDGYAVSYSTIWQRRNLVLVMLSDKDVEEYVSELRAHADAFAKHNTVCVVTHDSIGGLPEPCVLVADRWGEIVHVAEGDLPGVSELLGWVDYVERRCPECEGEAK
jgi:hypothetical protein